MPRAAFLHPPTPVVGVEPPFFAGPRGPEDRDGEPGVLAQGPWPDVVPGTIDVVASVDRWVSVQGRHETFVARVARVARLA